MGNVNISGKTSLELTPFQRSKLKYDFSTFFDLNNDGCLTYKDFLWAKDKLCFMSGWKIDSPKYKITEALFTEIWQSLERIADVDRDGKITKTEWLAMWTEYKREIVCNAKENKNFLKGYYRASKRAHEREFPPPGDGAEALEDKAQPESNFKLNEAVDGEDEVGTANAAFEGDSMPVILDSDEEDYVPTDPPPPTDLGDKAKAEKAAVVLKKDEVPLVNQILGLFSKKTKSTNDVSSPDKEAATQETKIDIEKDEGEKEEEKEEEVEKSPTTLDMFAEHETDFSSTVLPKWLFKYLVFRFNLLDRCGDNFIDVEEFSYVLSEFECSEKTARQAFLIFTQNDTVKLDFDYFVHLFEEYYLSNDPSDLGNFINGKLQFEDDLGKVDDAEDEDPGLVDHRKNSSTSVHSMDDDINPYAAASKLGNGHHSSTIKLHEEPNTCSWSAIKDRVRKCCVI